MNIIKRGQNPKKQVWGGECATCNTVVEARREELEDIVMDRDGSESCRVKCPVCGATSYHGILLHPLRVEKSK